MKVTQRKPDFGVVVGGDGVFSDYGRLISIPLLFVGVRSAEPTASKGYLAEVHFDHLREALEEIKRKRYTVVEYRRLEVEINGVVRGEVFTDVYLEKGADSNCLRYHLDVQGKGPRLHRLGDSQRRDHLHQRRLDRLLLVRRQAAAGETGSEPDSYTLIGRRRGRRVPHRPGPHRPETTPRRHPSGTPFRGGLRSGSGSPATLDAPALRGDKIQERNPREGGGFHRREAQRQHDPGDQAGTKGRVASRSRRSVNPDLSETRGVPSMSVFMVSWSFSPFPVHTQTTTASFSSLPPIS